MGFRFSIENANWLAHILQPSGATPKSATLEEARSTLKYFLESFDYNFVGHPKHYRTLLNLTGRALDELRHQVFQSTGDAGFALRGLREAFRGTPWIALIIPSGYDLNIDNHLGSRDLLQKLVNIRPGDPGLILQLEDIPTEGFSLEHVFPAFKVALAEMTRWPGLLVWTTQGDSAFFPLTSDIDKADQRLEWIFHHLSIIRGFPDVGLLKAQYEEFLRKHQASARAPLRILHISDLHLGSKVAYRRISRVQRLIRLQIEELGETAPIVPVLTGDLMDTPRDENLDLVRSFMEFMEGLGIEEPFVVHGNHDTREDGCLWPGMQQAARISESKVSWFDDNQVALVCLNSVREGFLARGRIDERELIDVGNRLDADQERLNRCAVFAVLHHHPMPVEKPSWYKKAWYERLLGDFFSKTEELEDAGTFLDWSRAKRIKGILHGHKHIPRLDQHDGIMVIGCGSTVGKVETINPNRTYMSLNVVTVDTEAGRISCRLRAERIPGAGLDSEESHELVFQSALGLGNET